MEWRLQPPGFLLQWLMVGEGCNSAQGGQELGSRQVGAGAGLWRCWRASAWLPCSKGGMCLVSF